MNDSVCSAADPAPATLFDAVIGHHGQKQQLMRLHGSGSVPHALLFSGPAGTGKRTLAVSYSAALLAGSPADRGFDQARAEAETLIRLGRHPDLHLVAREQGKREIPVEAIRELIGALQLKPYYGKASVAIIDRADQMNIAACNALLKTLEEPTAERFLLLTTDAPHRLPETIISRCQLMHFGELDEAGVRQILRRSFPAVAGDDKLLSELAAIAPTTLGPLRLQELIDPLTGTPTDGKQLASHLRTLVSETAQIRAKLAALFNDDSRGDYAVARATQAAAELAGDKDLLDLVWQTLRTELRNKLRSARAEEAPVWADVLLASVEAEQLARERTLNQQLVLTDLLVQAAAGVPSPQLP